ncbi:MAG: tRNA guanosine(34) transglycosylase Tgt [Candidatus Marinimicrobia bacterium]|nr:tRNA guanosine(34) transglycosylase Tgt [Candidatus Neomarinimicrobiota bacterium]|tara:strand:- start:10247 stop:11377 length:1131 start_codon:yes stop_codon:yes gene_type:complete
MTYKVIKKDSNSSARMGLLKTFRGEINTPAFMPIGTYGAVKTLSPKDLKEIGAEIILSNTYHLYLRPGLEIINQAKGLNSFMGWRKPILTDSGGFQVFSLAKLGKINDEGVLFKSALDGSEHFLTPELSMEIQLTLGSDIIMSFDECVPGNANRKIVEKAVKRTTTWTRKCHNYLRVNNALLSSGPLFFPIIQGGTDKILRSESLDRILPYSDSGIAIGGLAVGENKDKMFEIVEKMDKDIPQDKLRYLMGVGKPEDILRAVSLGIDLFDCVIPTRNARNGQLFTWTGRLNILNSKFSNDFLPICDHCNCYTCSTFSRSYIRHLFKLNDVLGLHLATLHNVKFYLDLMRKIRHEIRKDTFANWSKFIFSDLIGSRN